ncbi:carbohydrate-binding domain-containing protein [Gordonia soli]|uniref:PA14 domain-containing protein n=1 Tax=Gordonia soli NBRC 108243 TaxID=1223545 RepID=M0QE34_9ACTN|nr:carbohydrate-binding domain-containing protein [Gordonia soli]GAC66830.1 hypothetical protein GS4_05_00380 [Gordonia soli NBRC 108243]
MIPSERVRGTRRYWKVGVVGLSATVVGCLVVVAIPSAAAATVEAETLATSGTIYQLSDSTASGKKAVTLAATNSQVTYTADTGALNGVRIRAKATNCNGSPQMRVSLDGVAVSTVTVAATTWTDYTVPFTAAAGRHSIAVTYINDYSWFLCDRNLYVDTITDIAAPPTSSTPPSSTPPTTTPPTTTPPPTTPPTTTPPTTTPPTTTPPGTGCAAREYKARYFNNTTLAGAPVLERCEVSVGGNFGTRSPATGVRADNFGIEYSGAPDFPVTGSYTFGADTGDVGVRVWLDDALIIDKWATNTWGRFEEVRTVTAGRHRVKVAIIDAGGTAIQHFSVSQAGAGPSARSSADGRYFAGDSFWNTPVPTGVQLDSRTSRWVTMLRNSSAIREIAMNSRAWTTTLYLAPAGTPKKSIRVSNNANKTVSIPYRSNYVPSPDGDAHLAVIDQADGCLYEFQGFNAGSGSAIAHATYHAYTGSGGHVAGPAHAGGEFSYVAGMITPRDVSRGVIDHALRFAVPIGSQNFVYPGTRTDGTTADGIPQGIRMRLNPSINLDTLGLNPFQTMVAKALQTYGGYNADTSGSFSLYTQSTADGSSYAQPPVSLPKSLIDHLQFLEPTLDSVDVRLDRASDTTCAQAR